MILLDTDTFTLFSYGHAGIAQKIEERHAETLSVTLITRMEVLRGRFESILKAADDEELTKAVGRFLESEAMLNRFETVAPDETTGEHFKRLLKQKGLKIRRADLLNACVALAHKAVLVTRNLKDYKGIKGLQIENWAD